MAIVALSLRHIARYRGTAIRPPVRAAATRPDGRDPRFPPNAAGQVGSTSSRFNKLIYLLRDQSEGDWLVLPWRRMGQPSLAARIGQVPGPPRLDARRVD